MAENSGLPRRDFLKVAGASASLLMLGGCTAAENPAVPGHPAALGASRLVSGSPDVIVIGAPGRGADGPRFICAGWGANVTLVDAYGPGNARSTSGDESRGVRSSYGDRDPDKTGIVDAVGARSDEALARV